MNRFTPLDANTHRDLRVTTGRGEKYGEKVHSAPVLLCELEAAATEFPLVFMKDSETGQFGLYALFGFEPEENLLLQGDQWQSKWLPLHFERQPFALGRPNSAGKNTSPRNKDERTKNIIGFHATSNRITQSNGERLFDEYGQPTRYLNHIQTVLRRISLSQSKTELFVKTIVDKLLIESTNIKIVLIDGTERVLQGIYTLNLHALSSLPHSDLTLLEENNFLAPITHIQGSLSTFNRLIELKNTRIQQAENT